MSKQPASPIQRKLFPNVLLREYFHSDSVIFARRDNVMFERPFADQSNLNQLTEAGEKLVQALMKNTNIQTIWIGPKRVVVEKLPSKCAWEDLESEIINAIQVATGIMANGNVSLPNSSVSGTILIGGKYS